MDRLEQDTDGGDDLPTYEHLAEQKGPNSRFGRWRGWVEKRAAERYKDLTPEDFVRRRERGWGESATDPFIDNEPVDDASSSVLPTTEQPPSYPDAEAPLSPVVVSQSQPIPPAHLQLHNFGSRFLPHSTAPIRCLLPILGHRLLLIGHDDGLSVLDMFPDVDPATSAGAEVSSIWRGVSVLQMEMLEYESTGTPNPNGVVIVLVGFNSADCCGKDSESNQSIRMYSLSSLVSLARWATSQKDSAPLNLRPSQPFQQQQSPKRHKHAPSLAKGFRSMIIEAQAPAGQPPDVDASYERILPPLVPPKDMNGSRISLITSDLTPECDEVAMRWATDYVPLATPGSRLVNVSVLFFELKRDELRPNGGGHSLLAIATKSNILLYETRKGERAFHFYKEFYTPVHSKAISFVQQRVQDNITRMAPGLRSPRQDSEPRQHVLPRPMKDRRSASLTATPVTNNGTSGNYGNQLSLFVVFEKKAGIIRLADSSVSEVDLHEDSLLYLSPTPNNTLGSTNSLPLPSLGRRSRSSFALGFMDGVKGPWLKPQRIDFPPAKDGSTKSVLLVTRGTQTHIIPYPLPNPMQNTPPLRIIVWETPKFSICHRIVCPTAPSDTASSNGHDSNGGSYARQSQQPRPRLPFIQLIGFGEFGIEVLEFPLSTFLSPASSNGKGKSRSALTPSPSFSDEIHPTRAQVDVGGDIGYLCRGGLWHKPPQQVFLCRMDSTASYDSELTYGGHRDSYCTGADEGQEGMYGWCRRGIEDWRVIWVGGVEKQEGEDEDLG